MFALLDCLGGHMTGWWCLQEKSHITNWADIHDKGLGGKRWLVALHNSNHVVAVQGCCLLDPDTGLEAPVPFSGRVQSAAELVCF